MICLSVEIGSHCARPWTWNDLPGDVTSAESTFRQRLKTHLFTKSFFLLFPGLHLRPKKIFVSGNKAKNRVSRSDFFQPDNGVKLR